MTAVAAAAVVVEAAVFAGSTSFRRCSVQGHRGLGRLLAALLDQLGLRP